MKPSSWRRWLLACAGVVIVASLSELHRRMADPQPPTSASHADPRTPLAAAANDRLRHGFWLATLALLTTSIAVTANWIFSPLISGLFAILASAFSTLALRGPSRTLQWWTIAVHLTCLVAAFGSVGYLVIYATLSFLDDIGSLLVLTLVVIAAVGMLTWLLASWKRVGPKLEPAALTLIAAILVAISLQGIASLSTPLDTRQAQGGISTFASDPGQRVKLQISVISSDDRTPDSTLLYFSVATAEQSRWALLLSGDALLNVEGFPDGIDMQDFPYVHEQIISGEGSSSFAGYTSTSLVRKTASRSAFRFPIVMKGVNTVGYPETVWQSALRKSSPHEPAVLDVAFDDGWIAATRSITQVSPLPEEDRYRLRWQSQDGFLRPIFVTQFDQQADDLARNGFFGIAILLGIAGACLIAVVQAAIRPPE